MNPKTATPTEIDTALAALYGRQLAAEARIEGARDAVHRIAGDRGRQVSRNRKEYKLPYEVAENKAIEFVVVNWESTDGKAAKRVLDGITAARDELAKIEEEAAPLEAEFAARRWSRFFLVTSSNGHIHSSMNCSTCNFRTTYGWMPEVSGQTMAQAIAEWDKRGSAEVLCTTCFPDAPSARTQKPVDENLCPGSGTSNYPRETARLGYMSGNYGVCSHCNTPITVSKLGRMRKHPKA